MNTKRRKREKEKKGGKRDASSSTGETPEQKKANTISTQILDSLDNSQFAGQGMSDDSLGNIQYALSLLKNDLGGKIDSACGSAEFLSQSLGEL